MGEVLTLTSLNGTVLNDKLIDAWFDANEMFVVKKIFSTDRRSVEVILIDEDRAEMMADLLNVCYANSISIRRSQLLVSSLLHPDDDERSLSPVHLSSASSVSSKASGFSQRLVQLDQNRNYSNVGEKMKLAVGRGRSIDASFTHANLSATQEIVDDDNSSTTTTHRSSPTPSVMSNATSAWGGRGRGAFLQ